MKACKRGLHGAPEETPRKGDDRNHVDLRLDLHVEAEARKSTRADQK